MLSRGRTVVSSIRVVLIEDDDLVREGFCALLGGMPEFEIVGHEGDGLQGVECVNMNTPDLVLMDLVMPGMDGSDAIGEVKRCSPETRVVVLSAHKTAEHVFSALDAGADGYLLKSASSRELFLAMETVAAGKPYYCPDIQDHLIAYYHQSKNGGRAKRHQLTPRERQVLKLIAQGMTNSQVAGELYISAKTVDKHRSNIKKKLKVGNTAEMVAYCIRKGWLKN